MVFCHLAVSCHSHAGKDPQAQGDKLFFFLKNKNLFNIFGSKIDGAAIRVVNFDWFSKETIASWWSATTITFIFVFILSSFLEINGLEQIAPPKWGFDNRFGKKCIAKTNLVGVNCLH